MPNIRLLLKEFVTHDVKRFIFTRPQGMQAQAGQAFLLAQPDNPDDQHPFSPVSSRDDEVLEFLIKCYPEHKGMTLWLHQLPIGTEVLAAAVMGEIHYRDKGVFVAGGTGITPFLAVMRELVVTGQVEGHSLLFSNRTRADVILQSELEAYFGPRAIFTLTRDQCVGYESRHIDADFLKKAVSDFAQNFYVCGPRKFVQDINDALVSLGASTPNLIFER